MSWIKDALKRFQVYKTASPGFRTHEQLLAGDEFTIADHYLSSKIAVGGDCGHEDPVRVKVFAVATYYNEYDCGSLVERVPYCSSCKTAITPDKQVRVNYDGV
jgi:hypothetical protein